MAESKFWSDIYAFSCALAKSSQYDPAYQLKVGEQLAYFLYEYRVYKAQQENMFLPGSAGSYKLITINGYHESILGSYKVPLFIKIVLPVGFPIKPPYATLVPTGKPNEVIQPHDYLAGNELRIPYLISWNSSTSNLKDMMKEIITAFSYRHPYIPLSSYPSTIRPIPRPVVYPAPDPKKDLPSAPIMPSKSSDKASLIERIKALVKEKNGAYINEVKKTISNMQRVEEMLNKSENTLCAGKARIQEKRNEIKKTTQEVEKIREAVQLEIEKSEGTTMTVDNVVSYIKAGDIFQDKWVYLESKRHAIEDCLQIAKKALEEGTIKLQEYLDITRKMAAKQFMYIYRKDKMEREYKKHKLSRKK